jgi:hypothetical protein
LDASCRWFKYDLEGLLGRLEGMFYYVCYRFLKGEKDHFLIVSAETYFSRELSRKRLDCWEIRYFTGNRENRASCYHTVSSSFLLWLYNMLTTIQSNVLSHNKAAHRYLAGKNNGVLCFAVGIEKRTRCKKQDSPRFRAIQLNKLITYSQKLIKFPGDHSTGATPVPIPNTVVKACHADDTAGEILWESR